MEALVKLNLEAFLWPGTRSPATEANENIIVKLAVIEKRRSGACGQFSRGRGLHEPMKHRQGRIDGGVCNHRPLVFRRANRIQKQRSTPKTARIVQRTDVIADH